jgi:hypothetical protein
MNKVSLLIFLSFFWFHHAKAQTLSMATKVDYPTVQQPISVAIGDLNGNGKLDLATANSSSNNISAILNQTDFPQPIRYVKQDGTGDGSSWANASGDIQAMLNATGVEEVWVAAGTYKPNRKAEATEIITPNDRDNAFVLRANVKLYGGFAGTETALSQRNWNTNETKLNGDFNGDDVYDASGMLTANGSENAYHVVVAAGSLGTARIDGFTLQGGYANNNSNILVNGVNVTRDNAGGLAVYTSSPDIANCVFTGNTATWGAGLCINFSSSPNVSNCTFKSNTGNYGGGILIANSSSSRIDNCNFTENKSDWGGGLLQNTNSSSTITNCKFTDNTGTTAAGGIGVANSSSSEIDHCTFTGNKSQWGGGLNMYTNSYSTVTNSRFINNTASPYYGGGMYNFDNTTANTDKIINCVFEGNTAKEGGGYMSSGSPATFINSTFTKNHATGKSGAIYVWASTASLTNSICYGNTQVSTSYGQAAADGTAVGMILSHNIIEGGMTGGVFTYVNNDAAIDARNVDPQFVSSTDYRLQCNSPALNAGDNAAYGTNISTDVDFAGQPRLAMTNIDLGAYEMQMQSQTMTFDALVNRTYGDAAFDPGATLSSGLGVNYTSSNTAVATIVAGKIQINGAGTTIITASGTCDENNEATADVQQTLIIDPKPVTVTAEAKNKVYGDADPAITYTVSPALVSGDAFTG